MPRFVPGVSRLLMQVRQNMPGSMLKKKKIIKRPGGWDAKTQSYLGGKVRTRKVISNARNKIFKLFKLPDQRKIAFEIARGLSKGPVKLDDYFLELERKYRTSNLKLGGASPTAESYRGIYRRMKDKVIRDIK